MTGCACTLLVRSNMAVDERNMKMDTSQQMESSLHISHTQSHKHTSKEIAKTNYCLTCNEGIQSITPNAEASTVGQASQGST